jgi:B12-binding domain/radical SAM domain protein of rhizo-twelve system
MKVALINPPWSFDGSIYFGCRDPHLPLELGYAKALLELRGHEARLIDGQLEGLSLAEVRERVAHFAPDYSVVTTAPSYLFWRCPPPELGVPMRTVDAIRRVGGRIIAVGPHGSTTPRATLRKLDVDAVIVGECEDVIPELVETAPKQWGSLGSVAFGADGALQLPQRPHSAALERLPSLRWPRELLERHRHHHHRFDNKPCGPGAEIEWSRGCPYKCTFCAKENHRDRYRRRPLATVLEELDGLIGEGVRYVYFIDEIFLPDRELLSALEARDIVFGVQLRIDNWSEQELEHLGRAGCVSIEAGVESITPEGRSLLRKHCKLSTAQLSELLIHAKMSVPFVQANLLDSRHDDPKDVRAWREHLRAHGVWANDPVPLFPYPGSPDYALRWGSPDDRAWERAVLHYLDSFKRLSEIQNPVARPLEELETP